MIYATKPIHIVKKASEGLFETVTDSLLLATYLSLTNMTVRNTYQTFRAGEDAYRMFNKINYQTIKKVTYNMVAKGLLKLVSKEGRKEMAITKFGRERLNAIIPLYRVNRPWDGHLYLISYDVPTQANDARNLLREYIQKTGGALLQESLWLNPYNPALILSDFVAEHDIPGSILVSKLGKDGAIGEEKLPDLIRRVYRLDDLAERYQSFLHAYTKRGLLMEAAVSYLSILKDDPQLPFPLEPDGFPAARAYKQCLALTGQPQKIKRL
ncbi:MAG: hypothetical protein HZA34_04815 [Candidatus Pacebacteria bacterium]|nr:hypothetical protein [Candidatus Paceibacterota bacterium]